MKFSIITATYNSARTITDTIDSLVMQKYPDLEYIVIDGVSKDETLKTVSNYKDKLNIKVISEPDKGLYDAMNKGVKLTTGDIVGILNSDDFYYNSDILVKVNNTFESDPSIDAVYGDLVYVDNNTTQKQTRYWRAGEYEEKNLDWGWMIPHPTLFVRRRVYEKIDKVFDTTLSLAADYELILRLLKIEKIKVHYIPEIFVNMRDGGTGASSFKQRRKAWKELHLAWKVNNLKLPKFFVTRRLMHKVGQFFVRPK